MAAALRPGMTLGELAEWARDLMENPPPPPAMMPHPCRIWREGEDGTRYWFVGGVPARDHRGLDPIWTEDYDQARVVRHQATYDWVMALGVGATAEGVGGRAA